MVESSFSVPLKMMGGVYQPEAIYLLDDVCSKTGRVHQSTVKSEGYIPYLSPP